MGPRAGRSALPAGAPGADLDRMQSLLSTLGAQQGSSLALDRLVDQLADRLANALLGGEAAA